MALGGWYESRPLERLDLKKQATGCKAWQGYSLGMIVTVDNSRVNGKGWITSVLPQMEEQALFDQFALGFKGNFWSEGGLRSPVCRQALRTQLTVLQSMAIIRIRSRVQRP